MDREIPAAQSSLAPGSTSPSRVRPSSPREYDYGSDSSLSSLTDSDPEHNLDSANPSSKPESSKASESSKISKVPLSVALEIVKASPEHVVLDRDVYFRSLNGFENRGEVFRNTEAHSYPWDNLILSTISSTVTTSPYNIAIAALPQDTLHAPKSHVGNDKSKLEGDQTPDFKILGWLSGEQSPSHANSSYLFFIYEKKKMPDSRPLDYVPTSMELLSTANLEQLARQAVLAFMQYDVTSVHIISVIATYFSVLKYERPEVIPDRPEWHKIRPTPLCSFTPVMKDSRSFSDAFLWFLRMMIEVVDAPGPGGNFSTHFQPSWFDPVDKDADFLIRGQDLVDAQEAINGSMKYELEDGPITDDEQKAERDQGEEGKDDEQEQEVAEGKTGKETINSTKRMALFPDATFQPTEEIRKGGKGKEKAQEQKEGKERETGRGKGKEKRDGKRRRSDSVELRPLFAAGMGRPRPAAFPTNAKVPKRPKRK